MEKEMKRLLKNELKREADEIMKEVAEDPEVVDLKAPPELGESLFARIESYKQEKAEKEAENVLTVGMTEEKEDGKVNGEAAAAMDIPIEKMVRETEKEVSAGNAEDAEIRTIEEAKEMKEGMRDELRENREAELIGEMCESMEDETAGGGWSEEEAELIQLGRRYKKTRRIQKYVVLAAAIVGVFAVGITSMGGPKRLLRAFHWTMGGRDQVTLNSDNEDVIEAKVSEEEEAYQKIKDELGFEPVRMLRLPDGMSFQEAMVLKDLQSVQIIYKSKKNRSLVYKAYIDYRESSKGIDIEDKVIEKFFIEIENTKIQIKQYEVPKEIYKKWSGSFEYNNVQYFITANDIKKQEFIKIIKNLHFF